MQWYRHIPLSRVYKDAYRVRHVASLASMVAINPDKDVPINMRRRKSENKTNEIEEKVNEIKQVKDTKPRHFIDDPYMMFMGGCVLPCLSKGINSAGEDAIYFRKIGHSMAVADGVGSWKDENIDPGEFSREFLASMKFNLENEKIKRDPMVALEYANSKRTKKGTACVCVLTLDGTNISTANIGDTKFVLLRYDVPQSMRSTSLIGEDGKIDDEMILKKKANGDGDTNDVNKLPCSSEADCKICSKLKTKDAIWNVVYKSTEMQHSWNYPVQIGTDSKTKPKDASLVALPVKLGDIIIMASDGVFDNLFINDIRMIVSEFPLLDKQFVNCDFSGKKIAPNTMQLLADKIASEAQKNSLHPTRSSPYSRLAQRYSYSYTVCFYFYFYFYFYLHLDMNMANMNTRM